MSVRSERVRRLLFFRKKVEKENIIVRKQEQRSYATAVQTVTIALRAEASKMRHWVERVDQLASRV